MEEANEATFSATRQNPQTGGQKAEEKWKGSGCYCAEWRQPDEQMEKGERGDETGHSSTDNECNQFRRLT